MPILSEEDLERFRTKVCTLASSMKCDFGVERCNYSHNLYWARRCPFYLRDSSILRYIPKCCPDVELGEGTTVIRNSCPRGNNCSFAHSYEEIHYHPLVYKTEVCKDYRSGKCKTYYCHLVHGLAEYRVPKEYVLPRKAGLEIPRFDHVTIVDNVKSINTGNVSSGCFQKEKSSKVVDKGTNKAETKGNADVNETSETSNLKSWSSIKWKTKNGERNSGNNEKELFKENEKGKETGKNSKKGGKNNDKCDNDSVYDWYKLISSTKIDYTDEENNLNDMDKNYPILKLYDKQIGSSLNEYNQLCIYNNELSLYNSQFENNIGGYNNINDQIRFGNNGLSNDGIEESRNDALVRRNVNMWNDSSVRGIMEGNDIGIGRVSSMIEDSIQSYREAFQTSDLASSLNSINQDDIYSNILDQCEVVRKKCKESVVNKIKWTEALEECKKLTNLVRDVSELPEDRS